MSRSDTFEDLLEEIRTLQAKKQQDYGTNEDPFANVRSCEAWGIPAWQGAMIRAQDKIQRLITYAKTGKLANEGVRDAFLDLATYALIGLCLFEEDDPEPEPLEAAVKLRLVKPDSPTSQDIRLDPAWRKIGTVDLSGDLTRCSRCGASIKGLEPHFCRALSEPDPLRSVSCEGAGVVKEHDHQWEQNHDLRFRCQGCNSEKVIPVQAVSLSNDVR